MLKVYKSVDETLTEIDVLGEKGSWINLVNPTRDEIQQVIGQLGLPADFLEYPLDEEETSRIEVEEGCVLIIIRVPVIRDNVYDTIPLGIIFTENIMITVCLEDIAVLNEFVSCRTKGFYTFKKTRFLLQIFFKTALYYLRYLRQIDKKSEETQQRLHRSTKNEELIKLLGLEKSLVYFTTSLKANEIVMEKLLKSHLAKDPEPLEVNDRLIKMYEEDEDLLEDVITENKQAIEMSDIYAQILSSTMDAYASVISNNLNMVMKFLTSVTILLMIPTMVFSLYGMNVDLPFQRSAAAFPGIVTLSFVLSMVILLVFRKRNML
ncbi:magnesium transporter CorA family protein [Desulfofundulus thermobenzoicus]|uniref:Magnesium transporter CorA family protein n=1 Tax=Desulfofundulus thermobenzoicus TaxID=29376 RepID=A0A6N7IPS4_9FIRM|nr:magnesium transporter CorA family protein [Desulfofundulus thermobenzoicus]MQL51228.1 magnesium transporter CorA family protein [Desulfofundulus thermobenzoicus]HHW43421.1 magnesium transporter CorA family protein [Desulfotomaculum sp.]